MGLGLTDAAFGPKLTVASRGVTELCSDPDGLLAQRPAGSCRDGGFRPIGAWKY